METAIDNLLQILPYVSVKVHAEQCN